MTMAILTRTVMTSLLALIAVVDFTSGQGLTKCERTGPCSCKTEKGEINLSPLKGDKPPPPLVAKDTDTNVFYFNPCEDMTFHTQTGAIIQFNIEYWFDAGSNSKMTSKIEDGYATFEFGSVHSEPKKQRLSVIKLICESSTRGTIKYINEDPVQTYQFALTSRYACPGHVDPPSPGNSGGNSGLSIGSYLLIGLLAVIVIYVAVGVVIQVGVRKAQGRERVPNANFWFGLPGLVRDGATFVFTHGRGGSYQKM